MDEDDDDDNGWNKKKTKTDGRRIFEVGDASVVVFPLILSC